MDEEPFDDFEEFDEEAVWSEIYLHFILTTEGEQPWLAGDWCLDLGLYLREVVANNEGTLLGCEGGAEHLHLLIQLPPTLSIEEAVRLLKLSTAFWIHHNVADGKGFAWQDDYFVVSLDRDALEGMKVYLQHQREYHARHSYREEMQKFIEDNFPYDDREDWWV